MKPEVLLVSPVMARLEHGLDAAYRVHRLYAAADPAALVAEIGPRLRAAVVTGSDGLPDHLWAALPSLELVSVFGVGADRLDLKTAAARGVKVAFTDGVLTDAVADLAIGLWLAVVRRIPEGDRYVRTGSWAEGAPLALAGHASGQRVGILGLGQIGRAIARRAEPFGGRIGYHSRHRLADVAYAYHDSPKALAEASDVLFVAATGGAETRHLVDAAVLDALGPRGVLVNVSRGIVVDEPALVAALQAGRLGGAGLDVFVDEPNVPAPLMTMDNVVLQPHRGSATEATRAAMADSVLKSLADHFAGG